MFFFFNDTATTEIYTLSLHDALPISSRCHSGPTAPIHCTCSACRGTRPTTRWSRATARATTPTSSAACRPSRPSRSEEHTSELQSRQYLVCRLLLEKKKTYN